VRSGHEIRPDPFDGVEAHSSAGTRSENTEDELLEQARVVGIASYIGELRESSADGVLLLPVTLVKGFNHGRTIVGEEKQWNKRQHNPCEISVFFSGFPINWRSG
jgi:hypothetical protein